MITCKPVVVHLFILTFLLAACATAEIQSGSSFLRKIEKKYTREEFIRLDDGQRYKTFLYLGGKDEDITDGRFVLTSGFQGPHYSSIELSLVAPNLNVEVGDIVEMKAYATAEKNLITRIRQKNYESGLCDFITNRFLWNTANDLYCTGIENEGWQKIPGTYGTWYLPQETIK